MGFCTNNKKIRRVKYVEIEARNSDDFDWFAYSIHKNLGDKKWAKLVEQKAKELEEENDDEDEGDYDADE